MAYFRKANRLKAMGISARYIPVVLGFLHGDLNELPDEAIKELLKHYYDIGVVQTKGMEMQVLNKLREDFHDNHA